MLTLKRKRGLLFGLQALIVLATIVAAAFGLCRGECCDAMLQHAFHGLIAGLLYGVIKAIVRINHPTVICQSGSWWSGAAGHILKQELLAGFLGGWLLGLLAAVLIVIAT